MGVLSNMEKGFLLPIKFLNLAIIVVILGVACGSNEDDFEWTSYSESTPRTTNEPMTTTTSDDRSCPEDWINAGYLGCFYFDNTKPDRHLTWVEAVDSCNSIGGFLAEVLTEDQAEFLKSLATLEFTLTGIDTWWLGLSDFAHEGRWVWSYSGTNSEFTQWATGSPDMSDDNKNDCISMSSEDDFFWRDQPCYEKIRATPLCQRETQAPPTTTTFPGVPALVIGTSEIILLPPQSSNCSMPDFPVAGMNGYVMSTSSRGVQLCGGVDGSFNHYFNHYSDCYELPYNGKHWEKQNHMLEKRWYAAGAKLGEDFIISGGWGDDGSDLKTTEIRRKDGSWEYFELDLPEPNWGHCMVTIDSNRIFLAGGRRDTIMGLSSVYIYNKMNQSIGWERKQYLNIGRWSHSCSLIYDSEQNPFVIVAGGAWESGRLVSSELFDLRTETWSDGPKLPKSSMYAKMVGPYHIGGYPATGKDILKIEKFSSGWQWTHIGELTHRADSFDAVEIQLTPDCNGWS